MAVEIWGEADEALVQVRDALAKYVEKHPKAAVTIRRYVRHCIHIRVIDPGFAKVHRFDRHDIIGPYLDLIPDQVAGHITKLLPLAPHEVADSWGNRKFEEQEVPTKV